MTTLHIVREKYPRDYLPYNAELIARARANRKNPTTAEKRLWAEMLQGKRFLGLKFTRQRVIGNYIVDFHCSELMLTIELDGDTHGEQQEYDNQRTAYLNDLNIEVIRYTNDDIVYSLEGVYLDLAKRCQERKGRKRFR